MSAPGRAIGRLLIGAHLALQMARHVVVIAMLLRDHDAGPDYHATCFYLAAPDEILACWVPEPRLDNGPLILLLSAIELDAVDEALQAR